MTTPSKRKGSLAELDFVKHLRAYGWKEADRRLAGATNDKGDVSGVPGVTFEVKNHRSFNLAGWMQELTVEQANAGTAVGALIVKRAGKSNPGEWYAVLTVDALLQLLDRSGFGPEAPWLRKETP